MNFEEYLPGKKIDSSAFRAAEEQLWAGWKTEFEQMHPNSFTVQKLNLINPIRRKYPLKSDSTQGPSKIETETSPLNPQASQKPNQSKPVFKPKPKIN